MERLFLPSEFKRALTALSTISEEAIKELADLLDQTQAEVFPADEAERLSEGVKKSKPEDARAITELLMSLWYSQSATKRSNDDIAAELIREFASSDEAKAFREEQLQTIRTRLSRLLNNPRLLNAQNASSLLLDHERIFSRARVLTDLRPVFGGGAAETITGGLVVHTLKVSFYKADGSTDEFFVALDDDDIDQLSEVLTRAKSKGMQITKAIEGTTIKYIDTTAGDK
jgi:hypothetical protein